MANTHRSSFRLMPNFGEMFKVRKTKGYHQWDADDDSGDPLMSNSEPALLGGSPATHFREENNSPDYDGSFDQAPSPSSPGAPWIAEILVECFYLGSYDMEGLSIRGRGCIDYPAGYVWQQTQQSDSASSKSAGGSKPRRKNSWSPRQKYDSASVAFRDRGFTSGAATTPAQTSSSDYTTRYVRLVAGHEELEILDNHTREKVNSFNYRKISFVGTHPKYTRLFAFVAETPDKKVYCHAFKCESKESADKTACGLSDVFQRKIKEIQSKKQQTIEITASATVVD